MEVYTLDPDAFIPTSIVEGWTSCIFTEKFRDPGDMKLTTYRISEAKSLMPTGALLALADSPEIMVVETHKISPSDKGDVLEISCRTTNGAWWQGRATMTVLSTTGGASNMTEISANDQWPTDLAWDLIAGQYISAEGAVASHVVANTSVALEGITHTGDKEDEFALYGQLDEVVKNLLVKENAGVRTVRPMQAMSGSLIWQIYQGLDRSASQSTNPVVIFDVEAGNLYDVEYLESIQAYKTHAYVVAPGVWQQRVLAPGIVDGSTYGQERRIVYVDAKSEITSGMTSTKKDKVAKRLGRKALAEANMINFLEGEVSPTSEYIRGTHYDLGDRVTIMGNYGVSQDMIVDAFTRIDDAEGYREYPTLINLPE